MTDAPRFPNENATRLPGEPATGAPLASMWSESAESDPGGFVHVKPLDGLRGMAILFVLLYHLLWANEETTSRVLAVIVLLKNSLWIGVDLFFALSGFLITGILFDALHTRHFLRNFYGRRCVRIFPLYFLALAVLGLLTHRLDIHWQGFQWFLIFYLANTPAYILHVPPSLKVAVHLWSLSVEEQFYLFWPFVVLIVKDRRKLMWVAMIVSMLALVLRFLLVARNIPNDVIYVMLPTRIDGLLLGGWLALAVRGPSRTAWIRNGWIVFIVSMFVVVAVAFQQRGFDHHSSAVVNSLGYTLTAFASCGLIAMTLQPASFVSRLFSVEWLRTVGRYSYGIYVWHLIIAALIEYRMRQLLIPLVPERLPRLVISTAAMLLICLLAGVISFHLFEVRFLRLKRYFTYGK